MTEEFMKSVLLDLAGITPKDELEAQSKRRSMEKLLVQIAELKEKETKQEV